MGKKYFTRKEVINKFENEVIPDIEGLDIGREETWEFFLAELYKNKKITKNQKNKWILPKRCMIKKKK